MKLSHVIDKYQIEILITKSRSHKTMQAQQLEYWKDRIGGHDLNRITPHMIRDEIRILKSKYKNSTVNRYLSALSSVFSASYSDWEYITDNPMKKIKKLPEPRGRVRFLSDDERIRLLDACKNSSIKYLYSIVVLALSTGMRKREITDLSWDDIDLEKGLIYLKITKNGNPRVVPIVGMALEIMHDLYANRHLSPKGDNKGKRPFPVTNFQESWTTAVRKANIKDFRFHDLRHTCASYLAMNGVPLLDIATILGHSSIQMTQRYAHLNTDHSRKVLDRLDKVMFG